MQPAELDYELLFRESPDSPRFSMIAATKPVGVDPYCHGQPDREQARRPDLGRR
jgi:hypothetical protein